MKSQIKLIAFGHLLIALCLAAHAQGNLTPPGGPGPSMKSLDQIEARTPISALPYTISNPGSYYLTKNLNGGVNGNGIEIASGNVTLDLNGFTLSGAGGGGGTFYNGINVANAVSNLTVRNGNIENWSGNGIYAINAQNVLFTELHADINGSSGLVCGPGSITRRCTVYGNGGSGILTSQNCSVLECNAMGNKAHGISTDAGSLVSLSTTFTNAYDGIKVGDGSTVQNCATRADGWSSGSGIESGNGSTVVGSSISSNSVAAATHPPALLAGAGCVIKDCAVNFNKGYGISGNSGGNINGCVASFNTGAGILVFNDGTVIGNTVRSNSYSGIEVNSSVLVENNTSVGNGSAQYYYYGGVTGNNVGNRIEGNVINNNYTGIYLNTASIKNVIIKNSLGFNTKALTYTTPNFYGAPIKTNDLSGGINVVSTISWANFEFGP